MSLELASGLLVAEPMERLRAFFVEEMTSTMVSHLKTPTTSDPSTC